MLKFVRLIVTPAALLMTLTACAGLPEAAPVQLASHQAVYDLKQDDIHDGGGIESVRGRIVLKVEQHCDGLIVNQRMVLEIVNSEGGTVISDYLQSTYEDADGKSMRFDMSNSINGRMVEKYRGVAKREKAKAIVTFAEPDGESMEMPADVIFPGSHTKALIRAAEAHKHLLSAKVFDGNGTDGLSDTLAVIGKEKKLEEDNPALSKLKGMDYWPLQISFFDLSQQQTEPDYEVGMKMFKNGIASDLYLKYQDFSLKGKVTSLKIYKADKCS